MTTTLPSSETHACVGACAAGLAEPLQNPLILRWMAEHAEACRRLGILGDALECGAWDTARDMAHWLSSELRTHNEAEERLLFPLLDPHFPGGGPTFVMRAEHQHLWGCMEDLSVALGRGEADLARSSGRHLIDFLRAHIEKENRILYPLAERLLCPEELAALASVLEG